MWSLYDDRPTPVQIVRPSPTLITVEEWLSTRSEDDRNARASDFEAFHTSRPRPQAGAEDVVIISVDGKGIVMRPGALRAATASAAAKATTKLETPKGELCKFLHNSPCASTGIMGTSPILER